MRIPTDALEKVAGSRMSGPAIRTIFERMLLDIEQFGIVASELTLDFQDHSKPADEDEVIPVIILALRPALRKPAPKEAE